MNRRLFLGGNEFFGRLFYEFVLVEEITPIFFICSDDSQNLFACLCCLSDNDKTEWVVVPVDADSIIDMLTDKITIYQLFKDSGREAYLVSRYSNGAIDIRRHLISDIPDTLLPTPGYYMEADEGEFDEEIRSLSYISNSIVKKYSNILWLTSGEEIATMWFPEMQSFDIGAYIPIRRAVASVRA